MHMIFERSRLHIATLSHAQRIFVSFIIFTHSLIIITQSHCCVQCFCQVIRGLMIDSTTPCRAVIELRCSIIGRNELCFDSIVELLIEAESPCYPVIMAVIIRRSQREFLTHEGLFQACNREKEITRHEILIDILLVFAVLKRCLCIEMKGFSLVKPVHSGRQNIATIAAIAVIVHSLCRVVVGMIQSIRVATLHRVVEKYVQTHGPEGCSLPG